MRRRWRRRLGIAMGTGTDVAIESCGCHAGEGRHARHRARAPFESRHDAKHQQNFFWAFVYNVLGVPIAAGILYPFFGWLLNPMIAAAAMSFSSVSVIANACGCGERRCEIEIGRYSLRVVRDGIAFAMSVPESQRDFGIVLRVAAFPTNSRAKTGGDRLGHPDEREAFAAPARPVSRKADVHSLWRRLKKRAAQIISFSHIPDKVSSCRGSFLQSSRS